MLGFSLGVDAPGSRSPVEWRPAGVAAALDFRRGLYALPDVADIAAAAEVELQTLRQVQFEDAFAMSRGSAATFVDSSGQIQTAAANTPRFDWTHGERQLLIERGATNLFQAPFSPASQTIAVDNGAPHVLHVRGSGSVTLSGAASGVATQNAPVHFIAAGTSLTCSVSGDLDAVQVEKLYGIANPVQVGSSFIDGVRAADDLAFSQDIVDLFNRGDVTVLIQFGHVVDSGSTATRMFALSGSKYLGYFASNLTVRSFLKATPTPWLTNTSATGAPKAIAVGFNATHHIAASFDADEDTVKTDEENDTSVAMATTLHLNKGATPDQQNCVWFDAVYVWPRKLSEAELADLVKPYGA